MLNLFKIAVNAFRESVREPIYILMLLAGLFLIGHFPSIAIFVFFEQIKMVVDSSMATGLIFSIVVAVLCASYTISREMRNGTVLLLLSKPVQRWSFVLGKILGVSAAAFLFTAICNLGTVVSIYIAVDQFRFDMALYYGFLGALLLGCVIGMLFNFWRGSAFSEITAYAVAALMLLLVGYCRLFQPTPQADTTNIIRALLAIDMAVVIMSTIAVSTAIHFDVVPNLCVCTVVFFLGLISNHLFGKPTDWEALNVLFAAIYAILPNWQFFWLADALATHKSIPNAYLLNCAVYTLLYAVTMAAWGVATFQNREVAGGSRK